MKKPSPPVLVIIISVLFVIVGTLYISRGVAFIVAANIEGIPEFAVLGLLILALGALDILAGIKFHSPTGLSWKFGIVVSLLSAFASLLQVSFGGNGVQFSLAPNPFSIIAIIFPLMVTYSYVRPGAGTQIQSVTASSSGSSAQASKPSVSRFQRIPLFSDSELC